MLLQEVSHVDGLLVMFSVFLFSLVIGYFLIRSVPSLLHTPLMSMTNAISGVTVLGAILLFTVKSGAKSHLLGALAIVLGVFNLLGGFLVTDRMLRLFKRQPKDTVTRPSGESSCE